ncbi:hypothetical protein H4R19_001526 [Coemansia spiralis]|nr:hypothetical protein H4R19_001526 [Coemansia spiralis]
MRRLTHSAGGRAARCVGLPQTTPVRTKTSVVAAWGAFVGPLAAASSAGVQPHGLERHACASPTYLSPNRLFGVPAASDVRVQAIGAGVRHALVAAEVSTDAGPQTLLAGIGLNRCWQLGKPRSGASADDTSLPVVTDIEGSIVQISCGREHSAMIVRRHNGQRRVVVCGSSAFGQVGLIPDRSDGAGCSPPRTGLCDVEGLDEQLGAGEAPVKVQCGLDHTAILTSAGRVFAMGWGADGQLGTGSVADSATPVPVRGLDGVPIADISSSADFTLALSADGQLFYWGNAEYGQCMVGRKIERVLLPLEVQFGKEQRVRGIAAGGCHALTLTEDGRVHACGYAALGLGPDTISAYMPTAIGGLDGIDALYASADRCLAIDRTRGRVYSWGLGNAEGRLGNGTVARHILSPEPLAIDPELARRGLVALGNDIAMLALM